MGLVKYNNNSISAITTAGQLASGSMVLIKEQTASSSSTVSFVDGSGGVVLDSTYPIYKFVFINMHPASNAHFTFNGSTDGGSNYNVTKTSTNFRAYHAESGSASGLSYRTGADLAQSTAYDILDADGTVSNNNDSGFCGDLFLFSPSNTTFVKHYISVSNDMVAGGASQTTNNYNAGYMNTTSAINAIDFKFSSGNIDSGTIKLYGIKDS